MRLFSGIRARFALVLLLAVAPMLIVIGYGLYQRKLDVLAEARVEARNLVRAAQANYRSMIEDTLGQLEGLDHLHRDLADFRSHCRDIVTGMAAGSVTVEDFFEADANGISNDCRSSFRRGVFDISDRAYFVALKRGEPHFVSDVLIARTTGRPSVVVARAAIDKDGNFDGMFAGSIALDTFPRYLLPYISHQEASLMILDGQGKGIAHFPPVIDFVGSDQRAGDLWSKARTAAGQSFDARGPDGVRRIYAVGELGYGNNVVAVGLPYDRVVHKANKEIIIGGWVLALTLLLTAAASSLAAQRLVIRWLYDVAHVIRQIGRGETEDLTPLKGAPREWQEMASAFREMRRGLSAQADRIEGDAEYRGRQAAQMEGQTELLDKVLSASPEVVLMFDSQGRYLYLNLAAEKAIGQSRDHLIGRTWQECGLPEVIMKPFHELRAEVVADGTSRGDVVAWTGPDKRQRYYSFTLNRISSSGTDQGAVLCMARDISELVRNRDDLEACRGALQEARERQRNFTSGVARMVGAAARPLVAFGSMLRDQPQTQMSEDAKMAVKRLLEGGMEIQTLADGLSMLARLPLAFKSVAPVPLAQCLEDAKAFLSLEISDTRAEIKAADLPVVEGDGYLLTLMFRQVIGNALRYRAADRPLVIDVAALDDVGIGEVLIAISDNGRGFDGQKAADLFAPFECLGQPGSGPGLGLTVVAEIVRLHHGSVSAEGELNRGATILIRLPYRQPPAAHPALVSLSQE